MARVAFLGTPESAVPTLEAVSEAHDVDLVVTQPDRPKGRSRKPVPPPVKQRAADLGLEVAQPASRAALAAALESVGRFDLGVVVAYGRILRPEVLRLPTHGLLNVHFSLLPRWRGAAPVERALMAGDTMTGVTIMKLDEGLDTGPVLTAQAVDVEANENAGQLTERLARMGARLLVNSIDPFLSGDIQPVRQTDEGATYADKIEAEDRPIDPTTKVRDAINLVRGLAPSPAATLSINDEPHKVLEVAQSESSPPQGRWQIIDDMPVVGLADGGVELVRLQPPGRKPMSGAAWAHGRRDPGGTIG